MATVTYEQRKAMKAAAATRPSWQIIADIAKATAWRYDKDEAGGLIETDWTNDPQTAEETALYEELDTRGLYNIREYFYSPLSHYTIEALAEISGLSPEKTTEMLGSSASLSRIQADEFLASDRPNAIIWDSVEVRHLMEFSPHPFQASAVWLDKWRPIGVTEFNRETVTERARIKRALRSGSAGHVAQELSRVRFRKSYLEIIEVEYPQIYPQVIAFMSRRRSSIHE